MKTKKKISQKQKRMRLFTQYSQSGGLSLSQFKKMMKETFHYSYSNHVYTSLMAIWGTTKHNHRIITKQTFVNQLFQKPNGFLRNYKL